MPKVSVIIPCYNQGQYVDEAVDSVLAQSFVDFEIIIINDGSTDEDTKNILAGYNRPKTRVIHTNNQGLAAARNNGIKESRGEYILPLDSDDCIGAEYIEKAVDIFQQNDSIGIVYCRAQLFGTVEIEWQLPEYSLDEMLLENVIFCTALFRKADWEKVGGYDKGMIYGWEDYDFWLSLIELGRKVYQIPEVLFSYRVAPGSMVRTKKRWQKLAMFKRIFERHQKLFMDNIKVLWINSSFKIRELEGQINSLLEVCEPCYNSKLYVDTGKGFSDEECISQQVDITTSKVQFSLTGYKYIRNIRFDPIDTPAIVEIVKIIVTDVRGVSREVTDYNDNAVFKLGNDRYFATDDPQYFFNFEEKEFSFIDSVSVLLKFKLLSDQVLQHIVFMQENRLQDQENRLQDFKASGFLKTAARPLVRLKNENLFQYFRRQFRLF